MQSHRRILLIVALLATACQYDPGNTTDLAFAECNGEPATLGFGYDPNNDPPQGATYTGTTGDDVIVITNGPVTVYGLAGDDLICVNDTVLANSGPARVAGGSGDDTLLGSASDDVLYGGPGNDTIAGRAGDDLISAGTGTDDVYGGDGDDTILATGLSDMWPELYEGLDDGPDGLDVLRGGPGHDRIHGTTGNEQLLGGYGSDMLFGGDGDDTLDGGPGDDYVDGGPGIDTCTGETSLACTSTLAADPSIIGGHAMNHSNVATDGSRWVGSGTRNALGYPVVVEVSTPNGTGTSFTSEEIVVAGAPYAADLDISGSSVAVLTDDVVVLDDANGTWTQTTIGDGDPYEGKISIDGDLLVASAPHAHDDPLSNTGEVVVVERLADGTWAQLAYLRANPVTENGLFGRAIDVSGDRIVVGSATSTVHVFDRQPDNSWVETILTPSSTDADFGQSVAVDGDRVVVGGTQSMTVFDRQTNGSYTEERFEQPLIELPTDDPFPNSLTTATNGGFGTSVDVHGDRIVVGAPNSTHDIRTFYSVYYTNCGGVFLYELSGASWAHDRLDFNDCLWEYYEHGTADRWGRFVAVSADWVIGGSYAPDVINSYIEGGGSLVFDR